MRAEIDEIPDAVARLLDDSSAAIADAAAALKKADPYVVVTVARGSSDHAAYFLKYAVELTCGIPVASLGPSLASVYDVTPKLAGGAAFAISQSGKSPDIVALARAVRRGGALTVALANTVPSPLAGACDHAIDIAAGPERSVAATKSFVCSIAAGLAVLAAWSGQATLARAVAKLPDDLARALKLSWSPLEEGLAGAESIFVLGRGPVSAIAHEAALKFKETCGVHAEAYSAAEVLHGPVELVGPRFPVLALAARDAAEASIATVADDLAMQGAIVFASSIRCQTATRLPFAESGHPITDALLPVVPFYGFVEAWSRARGRNPDVPARLKKVTETR
jgi:glucosamine--fructose-6-phosphate aminotransferase (isomerizing)